MHKYYKIFIKLLFGLLIFSICISLGLILFYSEVYEFVIVNKFQMKGRKRKRNSKPNSMYNLRVHKFVKLYATENVIGSEMNLRAPKARSGHRIVCKNSALYAIGGYNPLVNDDEPTQNSLFCEVWRFDFITRTWKQLEFEKLPNELASSAVVLSGNLLFLHGGTGIPFGVQFNENVFICKLEDFNTKLIFNRLPIDKKISPKGQYGQSSVIDGKYLYTVGGTDGFKYYIDVDRLNLQNNVWERLFDGDEDEGKFPAPRYRHEIVLYDNHLYVFGGGVNNNAYGLDKIGAFNLQTNKWVTKNTIGDDSIAPNDPYPERRKCHGCIQDPYDNAIVFINGGYNEHQEFSDTWRIDLKTLKWKCMTSLTLPYGTYFHSASCTPDGRMVIFGGITNKRRPHQRTADVYSTWIRVPKLADACWEALGYYVSNNIIKLPENLQSLELPRSCESRLKTSFSFLPTDEL